MCNNDTSFMIIGLIPNLLAPLFVLQKRRREKIKKEKEEGKKKKGNFWCYGLSRGPRSASLPKGLELTASPRGLAGTLEGLASGLVAAVVMVMEGESRDSTEMSLLGRRTFGANARAIRSVSPGAAWLLALFLLLSKPFSGGLAEEVILNTLLSRNCQHLKVRGVFGLPALTCMR